MKVELLQNKVLYDIIQNSNSHQDLPMCVMIYLRIVRGKIFLGNDGNVGMDNVTIQKCTLNKRKLGKGTLIQHKPSYPA